MNKFFVPELFTLGWKVKRQWLGSLFWGWNQIENTFWDYQTFKDVNIFIDEICIGCNSFAIHLDKNLKALNEICAKIDPKSYLWITIARLVNNHVPATDASKMFNFDSWLSEKKTKEDFFVPSLLYPLRNSKEIVSYEASMSKVNISNMRLPTHIGTQIAIIPTNLTMGTAPITINYDASQSMDYNVQKCFQCLPTSRVVIIMVLRHSIYIRQ